MTDPLKNHIQAWLVKADNDLLSAARLIEIEPMLLDNACFFCQQAAEKYLKAFLAYKEYDFKKTHSLEYLLQKCSEFDTYFTAVDVKDLSVFAIQVRYPDMSISPD